MHEPCMILKYACNMQGFRTFTCKVLYLLTIRYSCSTGPAIYGSKPTRVQGHSLRTRVVYVAINPWQPVL